MSTDIANWLLANIVSNPQVLKSLIALIILIVAIFLFSRKPTEKDTFRHGLGASLFVFAIFGFLHANVADLADVFTAWATIVLAGIAALSFEESRRLRKQYKEREERDRKERLLNEIIQWAIDVSNCEFMTDVSDLREIASKYIGTKEEGNIRQKDTNFKRELKAAMIVDMGNILIRYRAFKVRNLYIVDVADTFGGDLKKATELLCIHVQAHTRLLEKLQDQYDELHEERVNKHSPYLEQYALDATKEAVKLKRRNIRLV